MGNKRQVGRGNALSEATTKGSVEYTMRAIRSDFYRQYPDTMDDEWYIVEETFADHVIVYSNKLSHDEFYFVTYSQADDGRYLFAAKADWEVVELTYQSSGVLERLRERSGQKLKETSISSAYLGEAVEGKPRRIFADVATADIVNGNNRRYPLAVLVEAVHEAKTHLNESFSQGRAILLGEEEHPNDKRQSPRLTETIIVWDDIWFEYKENQVKVSGRIVENIRGKDAIVTMAAGVLPGVSLRGYGESKSVKENGRSIDEVLWLRFTGVDLVMNPGFEEAAVTAIESKKETVIMSTKTDVVEESKTTPVVTPPAVPVLNAAAIIAQEPDKAEEIYLELKERKDREAQKLVEKRKVEEEEKLEVARQRETKLREQMGLGETDDVHAALQEQQDELHRLKLAEQKREVVAFIEKETGNLTYPDFMKEQLLEAIGEPETIDEAKAALKKQRGIFDKIVSEMRLKLKGFNGVDVLGPVLEREGNVPQYAQAAHFLHESLARRQPNGRDEKRAPTIQEQLMSEYLIKYDASYKHHLVSEARMFEEAEQTTDLNLPYSVMRAVIQQVYPQLITPVIFDYAMDAHSPSLIYYEQYAGETGETGTITDEAVSADSGAWVNMAHQRVTPGTVVVQDVTDATTYVEGTDYTIDYEDGKLYTLAGGSIADAAVLHVDYTYRAMREGEMQPIQRGKMGLSSQVLIQAADRLASQISREAVLFSRSQLNWDATSRTIGALVNEIAKKIDGDRLYNALGAALRVASNSGGTWDSSSDTLDDLVKKIGAAKVKVANRLYEPTGIVVSLTRSDTISNWDGFTAAGKRPDADMNAFGYVGRLKGLPVFESTQFSDSYVLVFNRELLMARTFQAMQLFGPYPSYDTNGKLIAADQYYVEEFNGSITPVPEKGAYVKIT
jgi:hypothetical protein